MLLFFFLYAQPRDYSDFCELLDVYFFSILFMQNEIWITSLFRFKCFSRWIKTIFFSPLIFTATISFVIVIFIFIMIIIIIIIIISIPALKTRQINLRIFRAQCFEYIKKSLNQSILSINNLFLRNNSIFHLSCSINELLSINFKELNFLLL